MKKETQQISHLDEDGVKAKCIDFLLAQHSGEDDYVIINELSFGDGKRRADIIEVNGCINAYEIKSDLDSLSTIRNQFEDYKRCFDTITIVTTRKHISSIKKDLPRGVGLILVDKDSVTQLRRPYFYARYNKYYLTALLDNEELQSLSKRFLISGFSKLSLTDKRRKIADISGQKEIREFVINNLKKRYKKSYNRFITNRGDHTLSEDIRLFWSGIIA